MIAHEPRRVLVTGAAAGIGRAIARRLALAGHSLVLCDRNALGLQEVVAAIPTTSATIEVHALDLSDRSALSRLIAAIGVADGLVNCAGIYPVTPLLELDEDEWDRVQAINLRTPFLLSQAVARGLVAAQRGGSIVNISSTASVLARPGIAHYGASKAALNQLTRVLAVELAQHEIRVNAVLPGVIATETVQAALATPAAVAEMRTKQARIPMGRLGTPEEIAELVAFLLSPAASYCTGALFTADGGYSLGIARY